jgi:hypothetical protein
VAGALSSVVPVRPAPPDRDTGPAASPGAAGPLSAFSRFLNVSCEVVHNLWTLTSVSQKSGMLVEIHDTCVS